MEIRNIFVRFFGVESRKINHHVIDRLVNLIITFFGD